MSILLALLVQAATLPADPKTASLACASAVQAAARPEDDVVRLAAHAAYFVMQAAAVEGEDATFLARLGGLQAAMHDSSFPNADAGALLVACDARFPRARATAAVTLPADSLRSDILCVAALGVMVGAARGATKLGLDELENELTGAFVVYLGRLKTVHAGDERVSTDARQNEIAGSELRASLALGNVEQIGTACSAALPD
jgi:hypothetical protein